MSPRQKRRSVPHGKLRSVTDSHAQTSASILLDASKYIQELKQKIKDLVEDNNALSTGVTEDRMKQMDMPYQVTVEAQEQGIYVRVFSKKSSPDLLVSILKVFEDLGVDVLDARVSCVEPFRLEAVGREIGGRAERVESEVVKEAIIRAIEN